MRNLRRRRDGLGRGLAVATAALLALPAVDVPLVAPGVAHAQQNDPAHQQFLFAYKLLQRGDDRLAAEAFDDYLGQFPQDGKRGDALYYRALLYRRAGQDDRAAEVLHDVPPPQIVPAYAVNLLRGQVLSDLQRYPAAVETLSAIEIKSLDPKVAVSVLYLRGLAQRGAENLAAAAADLEAAAAIDSPMRGRALLDLARVQVLLGHEADAVGTLRRAVDAGDEAAAAEAARMAGDLSYNAQRYDEAVASYGRVIESHQASKHFGPAVIGTLWSHFSAGRYNAVLQTFERHRTALQVQDRVAAWYLAGSAQQELSNHEAAVALFDQIAHGEGRYPLQEKVLYKLAASQFELGRYDAMSSAIDRLATGFPKSEVLIDAAFLLAAADAKRGNVSQGAARLTQVVEQGPDSPYYLQALLRRARLYETHGQLQPAAADYRRYLDAGDYRAVGQRPDGKPLREPTETQAGAFLRLLDVYGQIGQHRAAADLAAQWLAEMRLGPAVEQEATYRRALALIRLEQTDEALALLDRVRRDHPLSPFTPEVEYYRGLLLLSMDRPEQAVPILRKAAASDHLVKPMRINAMHLLAMRERDAEAQNGGGEAVLAQLEAMGGLDALTDDELVWRARYALNHDDPRAALRYTKPLVEGRPDATASARAEAIYQAGVAHRALGQFDQAEQAFGQVVAMGRGRDLHARLGLAQVAADRGQRQQALAELQGLMSSEATDIAGQSLYAAAEIHRGLAAEHRRAGDAAAQKAANEEALKLLKRLVLLFSMPELSPLPELAYIELAEIEAELNELDAAQKELEELVSKFPDGPYATYAQAVLAADLKRYGDAIALLRSLQTEGGHDPRLAQRIDAMLKILEPQR